MLEKKISLTVCLKNSTADILGNTNFFSFLREIINKIRDGCEPYIKWFISDVQFDSGFVFYIIPNLPSVAVAIQL